MGGEAVSVQEAASAFMEQMDENGYLPEDDNFQEPEAKPEEEAKADAEEEGVDSQEEEAPDESQDDAEEDGETPEDEGEAEQEPDDKLYDLVIDGEEYEVNLEELKSGYLRNEALVSKHNELEQQYQSKLSELTEKENQLVAELESVLAQSATEIGYYRNLNWEALKQQDPDRYAQLRLQAFEVEEAARKSAEKRNKILEGQRKMEELQYKKYLDEQQRLIEQALPEFTNADYRDGMLKYGKKVGFTEEELNGIADARALLLLDKARKYDELQVKKKAVEERKVDKDLPPVVRPGAPKATGQEKAQRVKAARAQLGKSGSVSDAAQLFLARGIFD